jgi:hypothetical protein
LLAQGLPRFGQFLLFSYNIEYMMYIRQIITKLILRYRWNNFQLFCTLQRGVFHAKACP